MNSQHAIEAQQIHEDLAYATLHSELRLCGTYRTLGYVEREVAQLAAQLAQPGAAR